MPHYFRAPPRIPTRAEVDAVLRVTDDHARDHILVAVAASTGLPVHELVALDSEQLVSEVGVVRNRVRLRTEGTKGDGGGDVVLNDALRWKIARYRTWCAHQALKRPKGDFAPWASVANKLTGLIGAFIHSTDKRDAIVADRLPIEEMR